MKNHSPKFQALSFIILLGFVSLFTDMTYQGARSITGPYLASLGASAFIISSLYGFSELIGHGARLFTGYLADKWNLYWIFIVVGYLATAMTLPFLTFTHSWQIAALLILIERIGKAMRSPSRDTLLSHAGPKVGMGWGFGIHKALDRTGAMLGPFALMVVMFLGSDYRHAFIYLIIPALLAFVILIFIYRLFPEVKDGNSGIKVDFSVTIKNQTKPFWICIAATSCLAMGYADFPLIAFHLDRFSYVHGVGLPFIYMATMGLSALSVLILGRLFDRLGVYALIFIALLSSFFPALVFLGSLPLAVLGVFIWGIGMGANESLMKSMVGNITSYQWRGSFYGIFNTAYGASWFIGSVIIGLLYDVSLALLVLFATLIQLLAVPLFFWLGHVISRQKND